MDRIEFVETYNTMLDDAALIIHSQQVLAGIHDQLDRNLLNPLEQDYIYHDHFGRFPAEPITISRYGVKITTRILHQTGERLSDIQDADMLYEIEKKKFILLQYKRASSHQVRNDAKQMADYFTNCPEKCPTLRSRRGRPLPTEWIPVKSFAHCGYWYRLVDGPEHRNLTACEVESIFQEQSCRSFQAFEKGMSHETFMELFASCRIGALLLNQDIYNRKDLWIRKLLGAGHFILSILQSDFWRSE